MVRARPAVQVGWQRLDDAANDPPGLVAVERLKGRRAAGETTLSSRWLRRSAGRRAAVPIAEVGETGVDPDRLERAQTASIELRGGCAGWKVRLDLVRLRPVATGAGTGGVRARRDRHRRAGRSGTDPAGSRGPPCAGDAQRSLHPSANCAIL